MRLEMAQHPRPGFDQRRWDAGPKTLDRFIACGGLRRADRNPIPRPIFTERRRAPRFWRRFGGAIIGALVVLMYFAYTGRI